MYYALFDRNFTSLGNRRKAYPCSSYSLKLKANEFNEVTLKGFGIDNTDDAMYVVLYDMSEDGTMRIKHISFCGIPVTENGMTTINAVDVRQMLNNEAIITIDQNMTVSELYAYLLSALFDTEEHGYSNWGVTVAEPDVSETEEIEAIPDAIVSGTGISNVWKLLQAVNSVYDCFISAEVNITGKTVRFSVKRISSVKNINLADFGKEAIRKDFTTVNSVACYEKDNYSTRAVYYLLKNDTVLYDNGSITPSNIAIMIFPKNIKVIEKETLAEAKAEGLQTLYKNRFKTNVEIPLETPFAKRQFEGVDHSYFLNISGYKTLPVMEISEDSNGKKSIKAGRLEEYWWQ